MYISVKKRLLCVALLCLCVLSTTANAQSKIIRIPYGTNRYITYNLSNGLYDVHQNGTKVFDDVSASAVVDKQTLSSAKYSKRTYTKTVVKTGFGKGIKHVITLTGKALPTMQQVFYIYNNGSFFTQLIITGKYISTNNMVPFAGRFRQLSGDVYSLFMPFDNDTFISYNARPFKGNEKVISAEVGAVYDNNTRGGLVVGSVEHMVWKTGVTTASAETNTIKVAVGYTEESVTRDKIAHGLVSGSEVRSPLIFVGYFADYRTGLEAFGKANRTAEPPFVARWTKPTPVGWNSWGVMQEKLTFDKAIKVADFFADSLKGFRLGNTAYIDLDSYWDNMLVNKNGERDFSKLKEFADHCKAKGLQPGIYWAPFTDWGFQSGPGRKIEGSNYTWGEAWTKIGNQYHELDGACAIDPTHPGTQARINYMIDHFKACGFTMIKIDFLGHAAVESTGFYDKSVTTGMQAYRKGMEYLIKRIDGQMLIYAAISPSLASGRYVHTRRIACDAFKSIKDSRYTLNSVTYGWWQSYVYDYVDADHIVFSTESEGANRARLLSGLITGTLITGDDYSANGLWKARAKEYLQNPELLTIVKNGKAFKPVDGNVGDGASAVFVNKIGKSYYVAVFNYTDKEANLKLDAKRLGIPAKCTVTEILDIQKPALFNNEIDVSLPVADAVIYRFDPS
ncbi:alpha-galactosidase [Mucilaginibacter sp. UR6-1]|uniref:alpha-galactosidase n=1 Tax=Mucilaginibacter sp. UR6-1 TaxID=1435643 RepID=UPI001E615B8C|nr:alpha-galactosidase [Mucilaginibacter sp. UR6-1]MCC8410233.1 alpha-galactosidase [Mucilaginibacter sp. UR6-1]